jgi:hypothetical protein
VVERLGSSLGSLYPSHYRREGVMGDHPLLLEEKEGAEMAEVIGANGREWAEKAMRKEDMQAWMFRLLLE